MSKRGSVKPVTNKPVTNKAVTELPGVEPLAAKPVQREVPTVTPVRPRKPIPIDPHPLDPTPSEPARPHPVHTEMPAMPVPPPPVIQDDNGPGDGEFAPPQTHLSPAQPDYTREQPFLFEIGWEVCWQLGGIYTVLRTKARAMQERWGDRYVLVGPYNPATAAGEFEAMPPEGFVKEALAKLREQGIACHYGRWLVPGRPRVILLDHRSRYSRIGDDKYLMWTDHGITTDASDGEVNDVVAFGFTVTDFFRALTKIAPGLRVLAHFHEWMAGVAVPRIAHERLPITTVFTTHATLLGRYLASDNPQFYERLESFNPDGEADRYRILPRHLIEKAAAHASTEFTTVSEITAFEAEKLLGRKPDRILPNGLDIRRFEAPHEFQHHHNAIKATLHKFVMGHFFPSYQFDLNNTLYFFTSGRYEYTNKGLDLYIEGLYRLNERLKHVPDRPTIVAFIVTRANVKNINVDALGGQARMAELQRYCEALQEEIGRRIFMSTARHHELQRGDLIDEEVQINLRRFQAAMRTGRQPLIVTHDLWDDAGDPVLKHIRHRGLLNAADDPVKIVFHPQFVTATSPLIGLDYEQFIRGCHLGIFPSYYEPWGYTPMECLASGIPAITTDLSGFGAYVKHAVDRPHEHGITVLHRRNKTFEQAADELADYMMFFAGLSRRGRIDLRNQTEAFSDQFDWEKLSKYYHDAHKEALERTAGAHRHHGKIEVRHA